MNPYRVDIGEIAENVGASESVEGPFVLDAYRVGSDEFTLAEPARVTVVLSNVGTGIVAQGTVEADVTATCARCLCEFPLHITGDVEGYYVRPGQTEDLPEEQEIEFIADDDSVDLAPALHAAIVLETPFAPLHDEECAGICPECGADLNETRCGCHEDASGSDHPFAKLAELDLGDGEGGDPTP